MATVTTRALKDQLSSYLHRAEKGESVVVLRDGTPVAALVPLSELRRPSEEEILARLGAQGRITLPRSGIRPRFEGLKVPERGKPASEMVIEDRR